MKIRFQLLFVVFQLLAYTSFTQTEKQLWGMCSIKGPGGYGSIFSTDSNGNNYILRKSFNCSGLNPYGSLIQASNGKMYGMTNAGGNMGYGALFEFDTLTNIITTKVELVGGTVYGSSPMGSLLQASNGKLYGLAGGGGSSDKGVLFEYDISTSTYTKKNDFLGLLNGSNPGGSLIQASNGKMYGMTSAGGSMGYGVLFEYDLSSNTLTKKVDFTGSSNGSSPRGSLMQASNGKLYGMTQKGGVNSAGVLFEYNISTGILTKLIDFTNSSSGSGPYGHLIQATNGKLYGLTSGGGLNNGGVLFDYDISTNTLSKKIDFLNSTTGSYIQGSLYQALNGNLYGMTFQGGANNLGVLFEYNIGSNTLTKKIDFDKNANGNNPRASVIQASNGKLYGLACSRGTYTFGILFEYNINLNSIIVRANLDGKANGAKPRGSFIRASNGKLYGLTSEGGANDMGVLFEYDLTTDKLIKKVDFAGTTNGSSPLGSLIQASNGKLYGMTEKGGTYSWGVLFEYDITSSTLTKKLDFSGGTTGILPRGSLIQASNGKLYGLAAQGGVNSVGVLFDYDINSNTLTRKISFSDLTIGSSPYGSLIQAPNGNLYGMTSHGGTYAGVLFEYNISSNTLVNKVNLTATTGCIPYGSLLIASNGKLYGLASAGGLNYGTLFEYDISSNTCIKKYDFSAVPNLYGPEGSLIQSSNGKLYGVTKYGGIYNYNGGLFEYDIQSNNLIKKLDFDYSFRGGNPTGDLLEVKVNCTSVIINKQPISQRKCIGLPVNFNISAVGQLQYYKWFKNGAEIIGANQSSYSINSVSMTDTGIYICYVSNGCSFIASDTAKLIVTPYPKASFTINDTTSCFRGNSFLFTNTSSISSGTFNSLWNFGDNVSSQITSPSHSYTNTGMFTVKLKIVSKIGCSDSITKIMYVNPHPVTDFTLSDTLMCLRENKFKMSDKSTIKSGSFTKLWKFGDNSTSNSSFPIHTFSNTGSYQIKLITTSNNGCKDSIAKNVKVKPHPLTLFAVSDTSSCLRINKFSFDDNSMISSGNYSRLWKFGDDSSSTIHSPTHIYLLTGSYKAKLITTSDFGCKDSMIRNIYIRPHPNTSFYMNDSIQCELDNLFKFINTTSIKAGNYSNLWILGDTNTSSLSFPSHHYNGFKSDTLRVKLIATSDFGCKDSIEKSVIIRPSPHAKFFTDNDKQCLHANIFQFKNKSDYLIGTGLAFWQFEDGDTSNINNPIHTYQKSGTYRVMLKILSDIGCTDTVSQKIIVHSQPESAILINDTAQCIRNNQFLFKNDSKINNDTISAFFWDFGDSATLNTSDTATISHKYLKTGNFSIQLISISNNKCVDTIEKLIKVKPQPVVNLGKDTILSSNNTILLDAGLGSDSYLWSDSSKKSSLLVDSVGVGKGKKTIWVLITKNGCTASDTIEISFNKDNGIAKNKNIYQDFSLYPNPTNDKIFVKFPDKISGCIEISNNLGQNQIKLNFRNSSHLEIPLYVLPEGIYFFTLQCQNTIKTKIFIKKY